MRVSTSRVSSRGTISMIGSPGLATPPTVLSMICLMVPRTGDFSSVRVTRSLPAASDSVSEASSARRLFISSTIWLFISALRSSYFWRASCAAASALGMDALSTEISPCRAATFCCWLRKSTLEYRLRATSPCVMPTCCKASPSSRSACCLRFFSSSISCARWTYWEWSTSSSAVRCFFRVA